MNINFISNSTFIHLHFISDKIVKEVKKKGTIVTVIALAALSFLSFYLIYRHWKKEKELQEQLEETNLQGQNIDLLSADWKDKVLQEQGEVSYEQEVAAIKAIKQQVKAQKGQYQHLLSQDHPQYAALLQSLFNLSASFDNRRHQIVYHALEIRKIYQKTHYVFLHGRALDLKIYSFFTKTLMRELNPDFKIQMMEMLRAPLKEHLFHNAEEFKAKYSINDHNFHISSQIICADGYWLNHIIGESALDFFLLNSSMGKHINPNFTIKTYQPLILACLDKEIPEEKTLIESTIEKISKIVQEMNDRIKTNPRPGELVVICIPKSLVQDPKTNPIYRSYPGGFPYPLSGDKKIDIPFLEKLQQDADISDLHLDTAGVSSIAPETCLQYRILTEHLTPKNGVRIFGIHCLSKKAKQIYKEPIRKLVQEIVAASSLKKASKEEGSTLSS